MIKQILCQRMVTPHFIFICRINPTKSKAIISSFLYMPYIFIIKKLILCFLTMYKRGQKGVKLHLHVVFILLILSCIQNAYAQISNPVILHYSTDNGLPQNSIKDISFDNNGYCWLGTEAGMVRFDGRVFSSFKSMIKGKNRVAWFYRSNKDTFYIQYGGSKLEKFYAKNKTEFYQEKTSNLQLLPFGTPFNSSWMQSRLKKNNIKKSEIDKLIGLGDKEIYLLMDTQLVYINNNSINTLQTIEAKHLYLIKKDLILFSPDHRKYSIYKEGRSINLNSKLEGILAEDYDDLKKAKVICNQDQMYLIVNKSIYQVDVKNNQLSVHLILKKTSISNITCIYNFKELETYFIGTLTNGLYIVSSSPFTNKKFPSDNNLLNNFYGQILVNNEIIANGYYECNINKPSPTLNSTISQRHLAISNKADLLYYDKGSIININLITKKRTNLKGSLADAPTHLLEGRPIQYGCTPSIVFAIKKDSILPIHQIKNASSNLSIQHYTNDSLIIGRSNGVFIMDKASTMTRQVLHTENARSIYQDRYKNWWIGTYQNGYYLLMDNKIRKMPLDIEKRLNIAHAFYHDSLDRLWISTDNGLLCTDYKKLISNTDKNNRPYFRIFDKSNGLESNEFNGACNPMYVKYNDGTISLPSMGSLVQFKPENVTFTASRSEIFLDDVAYNNTRLVNNLEEIIFPAESSYYLFEISSPYYQNKENRLLEYKLDNEEIWTIISDGKIKINSLPPGKHSLCLRLNTRSNYEKRIYFLKEPFFYQTSWFIILCILVLFLAIYSVANYYIKKEKRIQKRLQLKVDERTQELQKTLKELELSEFELNKIVLAHSKLLNIVTHDLRSPLSSLKILSKDIYEKVPEAKKELRQSSLEMVKGLTHLNNFTQSFFEWINLNRAGIKINKEWIELESLLMSLLSLHTFSENKFKLELQSKKIFTDHQILHTILRNLLDNANKNTVRGKITIKSSSTIDKTFIEIIDSGKGMTEEVQRQLEASFDKEFTSDSSGLGFKIIIELLKLIDGKLHLLKSKKGAHLKISINTN